MLRSNGAEKAISQSASPATGATVQITETSQDVSLMLTPAATLATLTVTLPTTATTRIGRMVTIGSNKAITLLTINGGTVYGLPTGLAIGDNIVLEEKSAGIWMRQI